MFYGYAAVEKIAIKIWKGSFPKIGGAKWCDANDIGLDLTRDMLHGVSTEWSQVTDKLEIKLAPPRANLTGRLFVRKISQ